MLWCRFPVKVSQILNMKRAGTNLTPSVASQVWRKLWNLIMNTVLGNDSDFIILIWKLLELKSSKIVSNEIKCPNTLPCRGQLIANTIENAPLNSCQNCHNEQAKIWTCDHELCNYNICDACENQIEKNMDNVSLLKWIRVMIDRYYCREMGRKFWFFKGP